MWSCITSVVFKSGKIAIFCFFFGWRRRGQGYCWQSGHSCNRWFVLFFFSFALGWSMGDGKHLFLFEIGDEGGSSSRGFADIQIFLELVVLWLYQHGNLVVFFLFEVGLFIRAIWGGMASLSTNSTLNSSCIFWLEGTGPGSMTLLLAVITVILEFTHYYLIVAVE